MYWTKYLPWLPNELYLEIQDIKIKDFQKKVKLLQEQISFPIYVDNDNDSFPPLEHIRFGRTFYYYY